MGRKLHESVTMPKYPQLLHELNQMSIRIKAWHIIDWEQYTAEQKDKLQSHNPNPTWEEIDILLEKARRAINEQRESPIKY